MTVSFAFGSLGRARTASRSPVGGRSTVEPGCAERNQTTHPKPDLSTWTSPDTNRPRIRLYFISLPHYRGRGNAPRAVSLLFELLVAKRRKHTRNRYMSAARGCGGGDMVMASHTEEATRSSLGGSSPPSPAPRPPPPAGAARHCPFAARGAAHESRRRSVTEARKAGMEWRSCK